ncbi:exported hypothetical protein [Paraburkholderia ribeironis]|uniref:Uncharacterized protein n=1 Tax=Paraburkholderia ribeironis TaxID=1247936 RepID=A0A1N7SLN7_9BURK|nr:exported hypothetical protein [Paraburkholderia ribeironis]
MILAGRAPGAGWAAWAYSRAVAALEGLQTAGLQTAGAQTVRPKKTGAINPGATTTRGEW